MLAYYNGTRRGAHLVRLQIYHDFRSGMDITQLCHYHGLSADEVRDCINHSKQMEDTILWRLRLGHRVSVIEDDYKHLGYHFAAIMEIWKQNATAKEQKNILLKI